MIGIDAEVGRRSISQEIQAIGLDIEVYKYKVETFTDMKKFEDRLNKLGNAEITFFVGADITGWWAVLVIKGWE